MTDWWIERSVKRGNKKLLSYSHRGKLTQVFVLQQKGLTYGIRLLNRPPGSCNTWPGYRNCSWASPRTATYTISSCWARSTSTRNDSIASSFILSLDIFWCFRHHFCYVLYIIFLRELFELLCCLAIKLRVKQRHLDVLFDMWKTTTSCSASQKMILAFPTRVLVNFREVVQIDSNRHNRSTALHDYTYDK